MINDAANKGKQQLRALGKLKTSARKYQCEPSQLSDSPQKHFCTSLCKNLYRRKIPKTVTTTILGTKKISVQLH